MKDNVDIFIGTHRTFQPPVKAKAYKIIVGNHHLKHMDTPIPIIQCGDKEDELDDTFYSEIYMLHKLIESNYPFKKYVGFCHYRKYFEFMDDIPNFDKIFRDYDMCSAYPLNFKYTNYQLYANCHNREDMDIIRDIIKTDYKEYEQPFEQILDWHFFIPYNMVILKKKDFIDMINWIWEVLQKYIERLPTRNIREYIIQNQDKYIKSFPPNNKIDYHMRIGGYLAERLTNAYLNAHFSKPKLFKVKLTEYKYEAERPIRKAF